MIEKQRKKKMVKNSTQIIKSDLLSSHMIAGKIIYEKLLKPKRKGQQQNIDHFILQREIFQRESLNLNEYVSKKVDDIKTPQIKKKVGTILNAINLSKGTSHETEKTNKTIALKGKGTWFKGFLQSTFIIVKKIASSQIINLKEELKNNIFKLNKTFDLVKNGDDEPNMPKSLKNLEEKTPKNFEESEKRKKGSSKLVSDMKNLFDL